MQGSIGLNVCDERFLQLNDQPTRAAMQHLFTTCLHAEFRMETASSYIPIAFSQYHSNHRENIAAVKKWREAVGPDFPIMIDCYMSLTLPYSIELARRCEPYNVKWIEEALPPDDYDGYSELKKSVKSTLITTGEHEV